MSDLRDLYQQIILDHSRNPQNFRVLPDANRAAEGFNPLCGDKVKVFLRVDSGTIKTATFQGTGCAISQAAASLMTAAIAGKTVEAAESVLESFHAMVAGPIESAGNPQTLGKLAAFAGVREFPARVKCATLCSHTLRAALHDKADLVSTE